MQEASFPALIKTIFWIFAFYYIFRFLARLFLPVVVKKVTQQAEQQFRQQYQNRQDYQQQQAPHSDVKQDKPRETKKVGDYIDFEEVD